MELQQSNPTQASQPTDPRGGSPTGPGGPTPARREPIVGQPVKTWWNVNRLLVVVGLALGLAIPGLFFGVPAYMFLGPILLPTVVALGLILWRQQAWTYLTVAILGTIFPLFVVGLLGIVEGGLFDPLNRREFGVILLIFASYVFVLSGAIPGFRHARAKRPHGRVKKLWSAPQGVFALFVAGLMLGAVAASQLAASRAGDALGGGYDFVPEVSTTVLMEDFEFVPRNITVTQGVMTEIRVENRDRAFHTFTYQRDGVTYNHDVLDGATVGFLVLFDTPGTYLYWCAPHSRGADDPGDGMVGNIIVVEAS